MERGLIIIDAAAYNQLKTDIEYIKKEVSKLTNGVGRSAAISDEWLTPSETRKLLGIGRTKYFQMKAEGAFVFSQFGRTAKISLKSIEAFLKGNIVR